VQTAKQWRTSFFVARAALVFVLLQSGMAGLLHAYEPTIHQQLTVIAAKQISRCPASANASRFDARQLRIIAMANTRQADTNPFVRMFRWNYYDRSGVGDRDILWVIDTRFHEHFDDVVARLRAAGESNERLKQLGRIIGYVQDVTSPPHAVPVFTTRWWRLALRDRFDRYPVDEAGLGALMAQNCEYAMQPAQDYHGLLEEVAVDTLNAVLRPIDGLPVSWEIFWEPDEDPGKFGSYGPAGNRFGRSARFPCGHEEKCVLLDDDPLYADFARRRHAAAVVASMRAMLLAQGLGAQGRESKELVTDQLGTEDLGTDGHGTVALEKGAADE